MRTLASPSALAVGLLALAGACSDAPASPASSQGAAIAVPDAGMTDATGATCGAVLPGVPMNGDLLEAQAGYASELASVDVSTVADPFDFGRENAFVRSIVNFVLERSSGTSFARSEALARGGLGQALLASAARGRDGKLDVPFLRRGLYHDYSCSRAFPQNLAAFKTRFGDYTTWESTTVDCSKPKNGPRRLRRNGDLGVYVAETVVNDEVRETEVLFTNLRRDGHLDFAVYTPGGELTDRSTFATANGGTVTSAAPYTCLSCHFDATTGVFSRRTPAGSGAGCD